MPFFVPFRRDGQSVLKGKLLAAIVFEMNEKVFILFPNASEDESSLFFRNGELAIDGIFQSVAENGIQIDLIDEGELSPSMI